MAAKNTHMLMEMDKIFETMHAKLDQRLQQLGRQANIHLNSIPHSCKKSKPMCHSNK